MTSAFVRTWVDRWDTAFPGTRGRGGEICGKRRSLGHMRESRRSHLEVLAKLREGRYLEERGAIYRPDVLALQPPGDRMRHEDGVHACV